jgi:hypothetical protein
MATRILMSQVGTFVRDTLEQIRTGLETSNQAGMGVELPEYIDFSMEIVSGSQSLVQVTETETSEALTRPNETTTESAITQTTVEAAATQVTTEAAATDTETTERAASQNVTESGSDIDTSIYEYDSFEEA